MGLKVFISHSPKDEGFARVVRDHLVEAGHKVFTASLDVLPGQDWAHEISQALSGSEAMVVVLSPDAVASPNVLHEISYALGSPRYEGRVIPVLVKPTQQIPWFLNSILRLDATKSSPRVAAEQVTGALRQLGRRAG